MTIQVILADDQPPVRAGLRMLIEQTPDIDVAGDAIIAPGVTRRLIAQFAGQSRPDPKPRELAGITDREREVLRLVGLGMSNAEIAASLYITAGTVKTHMARLLAKLGARDRVQLVITAYRPAWSTPKLRPPVARASPQDVPGHFPSR